MDGNSFFPNVTPIKCQELLFSYSKTAFGNLLSVPLSSGISQLFYIGGVEKDLHKPNHHVYQWDGRSWTLTQRDATKDAGLAKFNTFLYFVYE